MGDVMGRKFCVKCGIEEDEEHPIIENLCINCYLELKGLAKVPKELTITRCPKCGSLRVSGRWIESSGSLEDDVSFLLRNYLTVEPISNVFRGYEVKPLEFIYDRGKLKVLIEVSAEYRGRLLSKTYIVNVNIKKTLCPRCFALSGGSYEAIVQLRTNVKVDSEFVKFAYKTLNELPPEVTSAITEVEDLREGINVKLINQSIARRLAMHYQRRYCAKIIESRKRVGFDRSGRSKYRLTISVRIPSIVYRRLMLFNEKPVALKEVTKSKVCFLDLETGKVFRLGINELWRNINRFRDIDEGMIKRLKVISLRGGRAYLMDIENPAETYTATYNPEVVQELRVGSEVRAVVVNGKAYLIPKILLM
ncbi:MAG: hypothetical protein DRO18_01445 [Thermoprotei archaeon]|nr:MAG: hypothetical protein DRO18_01445 [Thermoprotei archaeon]